MILVLKKLRRVLNERGDINVIGVLFAILIIAVFMFGNIDVQGYLSTHRKLTMAAEETLEIMKAEGGFDSETRKFFMDYCRKNGLDTSKINVEATSKTVQRGQDLEIKASTIYIMKGFKPLGLGEIVWSVNAKVEGLSRTYFREG